LGMHSFIFLSLHHYPTQEGKARKGNIKLQRRGEEREGKKEAMWGGLK
jgi:hypothetical protein